MDERATGEPWYRSVPMRLLYWLTSRIAAFLTVSVIATLLIFMRAAMRGEPGQLPAFDTRAYLTALRQFAGHLADLTWGPVYEMSSTWGGSPQPTPSGATVGPLLALTMPQSLLTFSLALVLGVVLGMVGGMLASRFSLRWFRPLATGANLVLLSFPDILLIILVQFGLIMLSKAIGAELVSPYGSPEGQISLGTTALAAFLLSLFPAAMVARLSVTAFDEVFSQEYIRTARSKGLSGWRITWTHALRNAIIPILSGVPTVSGLMISNLLIVEYLMNTAGAGRLLVQQIIGREISPNLAASIIICFAAAFTLVDGLVDLLLLRLDPMAMERRRVRAAESGATVRAAAPEAGGRRRRTSASARALLQWLRAAATGLLALPVWLVQTVLGWLDPRAFLPRLRRVARAYGGNPPLLLGTVILAALLILSFGAERLAPKDPTATSNVLMLEGNWLVPPYPPGTEGYPLGSDEQGRDILSRLIFGARYTLLIAGVIVPLRILIALPIGMTAAWFQGRWEQAVQRLATLFAAIPMLAVVGMLVPAVFPDPLAPSIGNPNPPPPPPVVWVLLLNSSVLILLGWPRLAESIRLMTRELLERPFVEGARAVGASGGRVLVRHILPHLWPRLAVLAASEMAWVMMLIAQLGIFGVYLGGTYAQEGLGQVPRLPDWSYMLARPVRFMWGNQWIIIFPGIAFFLGILGFNALAEGLRRTSQRTGVVTADAPDQPRAAETGA